MWLCRGKCRLSGKQDRRNYSVRGPKRKKRSEEEWKNPMGMGIMEHNENAYLHYGNSRKRKE